MRWLDQHVGLIDDRSSREGDVSASPDGEPPLDLIHFKTMKKFVRFLVYVVGTYTMFVQYLKGIYLTLNSWRLGRTADGWPFAWVQVRSFGSSKGLLRPIHLGEDRPTIKI